MTMNKKAISVMVGYVLLVAAAVVMGVIVYQSLKTYVPVEPPTCPEEVSVLIKDYQCSIFLDAQGEPDFFYHLNISLKNNGKFNIAGYFIHISSQPNSEIATIDISEYVDSGGIYAGNAVVFVAASDNPMKPGDEKISSFDLSSLFQEHIYLVEIIPTRFQEIDGKLTFVSCGNAKVQEIIDDGTCLLETIDEGGGGGASG